MTVCVCGHPCSAHLEVSMSVPLLPNRNPLYKVPAGQIATYYKNSTYEQQACPCGCTQIVEDDGVAGYINPR